MRPRPMPSAALARLMVALLLAAAIVAVGAIAPTPPSTEQAKAATTTKVHWGGSWAGGPYSTTEWNRFEQAARHKVSMVAWYTGFGSPFPEAAIKKVRNRDALPVVTWEPVGPPGTRPQDYTFAAISKGRHDAYLRSWANGSKRLNSRILIRFAPEMNGDWVPWRASKPGNSPQEFIAAWRHIVKLFRNQGATKVEWVWTPNVPDATTVPMKRQYPGSSWVNWVGLDGYNWGTTNPNVGWQSFSQIFNTGLRQLNEIAPGKRIMLAETASAERGGNKAAWIRDFFAQLKKRPKIRAFLWFNHNKETDWRIQSSTAARNAFRTGVADPRYRGRAL